MLSVQLIQMPEVNTITALNRRCEPTLCYGNQPILVFNN